MPSVKWNKWATRLVKYQFVLEFTEISLFDGGVDSHPCKRLAPFLPLCQSPLACVNRL